jgi:hypothetical protein
MTATTPDRDAQMLAELAELDLSAVRHVHAQLMAASEAGEVADLSRSYQRASRCLRQTLALKAKLAADATNLRVRTTPRPGIDLAAQKRDLLADDAEGDRIMELQAAVGEVIHAHAADAATRATLTERLDREIDDWTETDDFTTADLDAQVRRACRTLGLSEDLVSRWRDLPEAPDNPPDQEDDDPGHAASAAAPPVADTG